MHLFNMICKPSTGFEHGTAERVHGSLLAMRQLLRHPGPWMAHRHQRRRRRRRGNTEEGDARYGAGSGGGASGTATPFTSQGAKFAPQMLPPPARVAAAATPVGAQSNASSAGPSTSKSQKSSRGFFFPEGGGGGGGVGAPAGRGVVPPPPSPHHQTHPPGTPLLGASAGGAGASGMAAAMAEAVQEAEYRGLCEKVLARRDHKGAAVRRTVMALLPELVAFFPGGAGEFVEPAVWFLINTLRQVNIVRTIWRTKYFVPVRTPY